LSPEKPSHHAAVSPLAKAASAKASQSGSETVGKSNGQSQDLQKLIEEVTKKEEKWTKEQVSSQSSHGIVVAG
jgi:hypothetical protein